MCVCTYTRACIHTCRICVHCVLSTDSFLFLNMNKILPVQSIQSWSVVPCSPLCQVSSTFSINGNCSTVLIDEACLLLHTQALPLASPGRCWKKGFIYSYVIFFKLLRDSLFCLIIHLFVYLWLIVSFLFCFIQPYVWYYQERDCHSNKSPSWVFAIKFSA